MSGIITISRDYGAGGHTIAKRVAHKLGIEIYDRDIIRSAVKDSGLDTSVIEREEEEISRADAFLRRRNQKIPGITMRMLYCLAERLIMMSSRIF